METPEQLMWDLNTDNVIPNVTWWWWWWLFFIRNKNDPKRWKQLMILWSIKDTKKIKVMDHIWTPKGTIEKSENKLTFPGMVCAWFFDGKQMYDPYLIKEEVFESTWKPKGFSKKIQAEVLKSGIKKDRSKGKIVSKIFNFDDFSKIGPGTLKATSDDNYEFSGTPEKYKVCFKNDNDEFNFIITPINSFMTEPEYTFRKYAGKFGYTIYRIKGSKLSGNMTVSGEKEKISGSAYFQKIKLNSPAVPWYWTIFHFEGGGHLHYMIPHIGPSMFRSKEKPRSRLDWGEIYISKTMDFFNIKDNTLYHFDKIKLKKEFSSEDLPIFNLYGSNEEGQSFNLRIKSYSRAYWRFEQKTTIKTRIFFYNEYPSYIDKFEIFGADNNKLVDKDDLGHNIGHCEHSWGRLA